MKLGLLSILFVLILIFSVQGQTIEEQIAKCEQSTYKDLCLAALGASGTTSSDSEKTLDELISGCRGNDYEELCINAVAKSKNDKSICDYIQDEIKKESCLDNFNFQLDKNVREQAIELQESVVEINKPANFESRFDNLNEDSFGSNIIVFIVIGVIIIAVFVLILHHFHLNKHPKFNDDVKESKHAGGEEQQIINYIKGARKAGLKDEKIRINLLSVGWNKDKIESSFRKL